MHVGGGCAVPWLRVSVVDQDVPLLLSKGALKALGAKLDLGRARLEFVELETEVALIETKSGLCGFEINKLESLYTGDIAFPPQAMLEGEMEVSLGGLLEDLEAGDREVHVCPDVASPKTEIKPNFPRCELMAQKFLEKKDFSYEALQQVVENLPDVDQSRQRNINGGNRKQRRGMMAGLWAHGGMFGVAKTGQKFPVTIQYINMFMRDKVDLRWTSFVVLKNVQTNIHTDAHNATDSLTATVTFGQFDGGQLWVAGDGGQEIGHPAKKWAKGKKISGMNIDTRHQPFFLDPKLKHATQPWSGTRWCLSCYTARTAPLMDDTMRKSLASLGFPLQAVPKIRTFGISNNVCNTSSGHQEPHIDQDGVISPCLSTPHAVDGRPVAQPESVSVKHHAPQGGTRRNDGQQVHHAEEERRVCPRDPRPDELGDGRSAKARCGEAEVDLEYGQAAEASVSSSGRMEEVRCGRLEGDIREGGMSRSGQGQRQALGKMESTSAGHGNRDVAHGGDGDPARGRHLLRHPHVPEVSDPTFGENEPSHQGRFLWMRPLSIMHSDSAPHLRGTAHQGGPGPAECAEGERGEPCERHPRKKIGKPGPRGHSLVHAPHRTIPTNYEQVRQMARG